MSSCPDCGRLWCICGEMCKHGNYAPNCQESECVIARGKDAEIAKLKAEVAEYQTHAEQVTADNEQLRVMLGDAEAEVAELKRLAEGMYSCRCGCIGCVNREAWRKYKEQDNG